MARANVPQFGNWESEDNVPYTVYFDKARKNKGGKVVNPNDPQENPDMSLAQTKQPPTRGRARSEESPKRAAPKSSTQSQISKEDSNEYRQTAGSAPTKYKGARSRVVNESSHPGYGGGSARPSRPPSVGSEYSIDRSPLHASQQSRLAGKGNGSPAYEGKKGYDSSHGTPSRLKPKTPDNSRDVAIPKFGEWDVSNPQSADNYTYIFNKNARGATTADEESMPSYNSHQSNKDADAKFSQRLLQGFVGIQPKSWKTICLILLCTVKGTRCFVFASDRFTLKVEILFVTWYFQLCSLCFLFSSSFAYCVIMKYSKGVENNLM